MASIWHGCRSSRHKQGAGSREARGGEKQGSSMAPLHESVQTDTHMPPSTIVFISRHRRRRMQTLFAEFEAEVLGDGK
eukprot:671187-Pleurochrysis_carterae.AAC.1